MGGGGGRCDLTEGFFFLRYEFGGLIHGGAYFRNFTVFSRLQLETGPPWSSQAREGPAACSAKGVPSSFLSYFFGL